MRKKFAQQSEKGLIKRYKGEIISATVGLAVAVVLTVLLLRHDSSSVTLTPGSGPIPLSLAPGQSSSLQPAATSQSVLQFDPSLSTPQSAQSQPQQGTSPSNGQLQQSPAQVLQNPQ